MTTPDTQARARLSPLPDPENIQGLLGHIRGTLQALHGVRKQRNDGIRPELLLVAWTRIDGIIDTLGDCERALATLDSPNEEGTES